MADNFKVYIDGVIGKIDDSSLRKWQSQKGKIDIKVNTSTAMDKSGMEYINRATVQYKNELGQVVQQKYAINKADIVGLDMAKKEELISEQQYRTAVQQLKLELQSSKITTDEIAREKEITKEKKAQLAIQEKGVIAAQQFLSKKDSYKQTPEVGQATDISNQILSISSSINSKTSPADLKSKTAEIDVLRSKLKQLTIGFQEVETRTQSFGERFNQAAVKMAMYAATTQLMYKALQELRAGLQYVVDLNKEMTDIQIVTGFDSGKIDALSHSYNQMAKELGATTLEVARGSLAWFF